MAARITRRAFLAEVGQGALVASVGSALALELGLSANSAHAAEAAAPLDFGALEPLVCLMQQTPIEKLIPTLIAKLKTGVELRQLLAAGALANARTFGGEDYVGFHTLMALSPAYHMAQEYPSAQAALPVLKVLYRNTNRIQQIGGRAAEVLRAVEAASAQQEKLAGDALRSAVHEKDMTRADQIFAGLAAHSTDEAFNELLHVVQDCTEVHRVVLPYRAWDLLDIIGRDQAQVLLRQSVHYCVKAERYTRQPKWDQPRTLLPQVLEEHHLLDRSLGSKTVDDAWVDSMAHTIFSSTDEQAAHAAAAALADGVSPLAVGEAIALAANQLILRDHGRTPRDEVDGKPLGSVHGDSIGVHACDSANAWRNMARFSNPRNTFSCLILGAYQVALDRVGRGGDFLNWQPLPLPQHVQSFTATDAPALLKELDQAIRGNLQAHASAIVQRYGDLGHPARPIFDLMLRYATSEDGSLHAEKFYRTSCEEFAAARPAFRWRFPVALARVTASEYGRPAAGFAEARDLLKAQ